MTTQPNDPGSECGFDIAGHMSCCPHCGRPSLFPNVRDAERGRNVLQKRRQAALDGRATAAVDVLARFEAAVAEQSEAIIARHSNEAFRLAASDKELYASFYELVQAEARLPTGNFWDTVRGVVDEKLFPNYRQHIRFAALSLDQRGVRHYGDVFLRLKENMIAHRASVCEENSVQFVHQRQIPTTGEVPQGHRATWQDRGQLALVKTSAKLDEHTPSSDFAALLRQDGTTPEDDHFMEVHIYGPLSIRSVEGVSLEKGPRASIKQKALAEKLAQQGIILSRH